MQHQIGGARVWGKERRNGSSHGQGVVLGLGVWMRNQVFPQAQDCAASDRLRKGSDVHYGPVSSALLSTRHAPLSLTPPPRRQALCLHCTGEESQAQRGQFAWSRAPPL